MQLQNACCRQRTVERQSGGFRQDQAITLYDLLILRMGTDCPAYVQLSAEEDSALWDPAPSVP
jgi:hypothetical protein